MKTNTSTRCTSLSLLSLFLLLASGLAHAVATVPDGINYQGLLTDAQGNPVKPDGTYTLEFRLWSEDNVLVWGRKFDVTVVSGQFNAILNDGGEANVLAGAPETKLIDAFAAPNRFLGITIAAAPPEVTFSKDEIKPRQAILSAPYAIQAENGVPVGTIVSYFGATEPKGWLFCNGQTLNDPAHPEYADLRAQIGDTVPDLQGYFIRGLGGSSDTTMGKKQDYATAMPISKKFSTTESGTHTHQYNMPIVKMGDAYNIQRGGYTGPEAITTSAAGAHTHAITGGDDETRPLNKAFNYIIKY